MSSSCAWSLIAATTVAAVTGCNDGSHAFNIAADDPAELPTVTTNRASYGLGEAITVSWSGLHGGNGARAPFAWVGIAPAGSDHDVVTETPRQPTAGAPSGSHTFTMGMSTAGTYVARGYLNRGYILLDESPEFTVAGLCGPTCEAACGAARSGLQVGRRGAGHPSLASLLEVDGSIQPGRDGSVDASQMTLVPDRAPIFAAPQAAGCTERRDIASDDVAHWIRNNNPPVLTAGGPTTLCAGGSVTLTSSTAMENQWYRDGIVIDDATSQSFVATVSGDYTVRATSGDCTSAASAATTVTGDPPPATPTITPDGPTTFCSGGSVTLTSSSAAGNQWYLDGNPIGGETNQSYVASASGSYTVTATINGCASAPSAATAVTVNPDPATPTITPGGPTTFCSGGSVTLTSSSAAGNQWYLDGNPIGGETNQSYVASTSGNYTVTATAGGCTSAASAATAVTVNPTPAMTTITPGGPTTFCTGGSVTLTSSNATGNQWYLDGNPIGGETNQSYVASASGDYTVTATFNGCTGGNSAPTTVTVTPIPTTPTITPGGPTTFCSGGSVTLTSSSATGNQWHLNGNPIGGATNQDYVATASGDYTVIATAGGCSSAPSAATAVTVNPTPPTTTITPDGPTTFCAGGSVTLTSSSATGNQWYLDGNPIGGETKQTYLATASGDYTVAATLDGCTSGTSAPTTVTMNPTPVAPTITPGGPTPLCSGGSVTLTSSSATGNQWYLDGNPIGGATSQEYVATASGDYSVTATSSCTSHLSTPTTVTDCAACEP